MALWASVSLQTTHTILQLQLSMYRCRMYQKGQQPRLPRWAQGALSTLSSHPPGPVPGFSPG